MRAAVLAAAGLLGFAAWQFARRSEQETAPEADADADADWLGQADEILGGATATAREWIDTATGGILRLSNMRGLSPDLLNNPNLRALLRVIRTGEGTADEAGYRRIFGGQLFESFADHPRILVAKNGYKSTAAGAYQALARVWDETRAIMGLPDFSPASQDMFALGRIAARGALDDALAGRFDTAIAKLGREWASLPGSPYGQPVISWERARQIYASAGGVANG